MLLSFSYQRNYTFIHDMFNFKFNDISAMVEYWYEPSLLVFWVICLHDVWLLSILPIHIISIISISSLLSIYSNLYHESILAILSIYIICIAYLYYLYFLSILFHRYPDVVIVPQSGERLPSLLARLVFRLLTHRWQDQVKSLGTICRQA